MSKKNNRRKIEGITVVSPMYGKKEITNRMVFSVITQFISEKQPFKIHLVLVDDYIEGRGENGESEYDYYISDDFQKFYDTEKIKITLIQNEEHKYQGESREIGYMAGEYPFFLMLDCDDMLAPNCCDRYLSIIRALYRDRKEPDISCIYGYLYGFDTECYEQKIIGESIWLQSRCYNRDFIIKHGIHFMTGLSSRQGEDYPFIRKLDYAIHHDDTYQSVQFPYNRNEDCQCSAYWFPNYNSLSRKDPHYGQHLAGWTMKSSNDILDFFEGYNKKHGFVDQEDEWMKHEFLNMNVYAFYNLLDFLKEVASTDYEPLEEDWYALRDNVAKLRDRLKEKYWPEIIFSDVEDMLYSVRHGTDVRFTESWVGTFFDYMNYTVDILGMDYGQMREYCRSLEFDAAGHEIHSAQVLAWAERHKEQIENAKKGEKNA